MSTPKAKPRAPKLTDEEQVADYMQKLEHPLKSEIDAVRNIIRNADPKLSERIKWAAPSYFTSADLITFNPRTEKHVHLVFHHIAITKVQSELLEGNHKDRRMMYLKDMQDVEAKKPELDRIMKEYVKLVEEGENL